MSVFPHVPARLLAVFLPVVLVSSFVFTHSAFAADNIVSNGTFEAAEPGDTALPQGWTPGSWGTLTPTFTYFAGGNPGKAGRIDISTYISGDAKWYHQPMAVIANTAYQVSDSYMSNVETEVDIEYTMSNGSVSYAWLATLPSSGGAWKTFSASVTVPAGVVSMSPLHLIQTSGYLAIDNVSIVSNTVTPPPPPPVATKPTISSFAATPKDITAGQSSTLSWSVTDAALLSIDQGVGTVTGASKTVSPTATTTYTLSASNSAGTTTATVVVGVTQPAPTPPPVTPPSASAPTCSLVASPDSITVGHPTVILISSTNATDASMDNNVGILTTNGVKTVSPATTTIFTGTFVGAGGTTTCAVKVTVTQPAPPVTKPVISSFTANPKTIVAGQSSTLSWSVASATLITIDQGIGAVTGASKIVTPTATTTYTISAGNSAGTTTAQVTVGVAQPAPPPPPPVTTNLITNGNLEAGATNAPQGWTSSSWGSLTAKFAYPVGGKGGGKAAQVQVTKFTSGAANWVFNHIKSDSHTMYQFSEDFLATVPTEVDLEVLMQDGTYQYQWMGNYPASSSWQTATMQISLPPGAVSFSVLHLIYKVGSLTVDNASLTALNNPFAQGMVTFVFDDGLTSQMQNALPMLKTAGMSGTFAVITTEPTSGDTGYLTWAQIKNIASQGFEIAAHTRTHADLTTLNATQLKNEVAGSYTDLAAQQLTPKTFVYPLGAVNAAVEAAVKSAGFIGARGSNYGVNAPPADKYNLHDVRLDKTSTLAGIQKYVDQAKADKRWLVFEIHDVKTGGDEYAVTPAFFQSLVTYIKQSGVQVVTLQQGMQQMAQ